MVMFSATEIVIWIGLSGVGDGPDGVQGYILILIIVIYVVVMLNLLLSIVISVLIIIAIGFIGLKKKRRNWSNEDMST